MTMDFTAVQEYLATIFKTKNADLKVGMLRNKDDDDFTLTFLIPEKVLETTIYERCANVLNDLGIRTGEQFMTLSGDIMVTVTVDSMARLSRACATEEVSR